MDGEYFVAEITPTAVELETGEANDDDIDVTETTVAVAPAAEEATSSSKSVFFLLLSSISCFRSSSKLTSFDSSLLLSTPTYE